MEKQHQFQLWVLVIIIAALALWTKPAKAANEYLNSGGSHCETATLEPYIELTDEDGNSVNSDNSYNNTSNRDSVRVGIRLRIALGSTCTKKFKETMMKNELLKQQLEMLKLCARYKGLELGRAEFGEVKKMCSQVNKKTGEESNVDG